MKTVGIVGGLGPESTIDYYRRIIQVWQQDEPSSSPGIVIDSLDVTLGIDLVRHNRTELTNYLLSSVQRLSRAGCDFAALAANTPHIVFDDLMPLSPIPLLSIVEVCADEAERRGFRRVAILGTGFTMEAGFYPKVFEGRGIEVVVPNESERAWLHERYLGELLKGIFQDETRAGVASIMGRLRTQEGADAMVLAGTELPLLLAAVDTRDIPILDTTELHVSAIVQRLRS